MTRAEAALNLMQLIARDSTLRNEAGFGIAQSGGGAGPAFYALQNGTQVWARAFFPEGRLGTPECQL